jgi:hypothetical protein
MFNLFDRLTYFFISLITGVIVLFPYLIKSQPYFTLLLPKGIVFTSSYNKTPNINFLEELINSVYEVPSLTVLSELQEEHHKEPVAPSVYEIRNLSPPINLKIVQ